MDPVRLMSVIKHADHGYRNKWYHINHSTSVAIKKNELQGRLEQKSVYYVKTYSIL